MSKVRYRVFQISEIHTPFTNDIILGQVINQLTVTAVVQAANSLS